MPTLKKLILCGDLPNLCYIKQILECGIDLNYLQVGLREVTVDLEEYNSLVALAKHKAVHVYISIFDGILNVDENVLLANFGILCPLGRINASNRTVM